MEGVGCGRRISAIADVFQQQRRGSSRVQDPDRVAEPAIKIAAADFKFQIFVNWSAKRRMVFAFLQFQLLNAAQASNIGNPVNLDSDGLWKTVDDENRAMAADKFVCYCHAEKEEGHCDAEQ